MKLSFVQTQIISYVNYSLQKLLCILANKNKCIGAMYYGNVCQNSDAITAYKIIATNSISASISVRNNCTIV